MYLTRPKPERLLQRILILATNPGDLVLDSFAGSGTTGAVAQKMGRRWIMIELGEHCHTHITPRMQKVIDGEDQGGISKAVNWKGGGGFRYYRLGPSLIVEDAWGNPVINQKFNAALTTLYWQIGKRINDEILKGNRAGYGEQIVSTLSRQLVWSHFLSLIPLKGHLERDFYAEMCRVERWSVRTLRKKIDSMLYERTALSKKPDELIRYELNELRESDRITPDLVFRDPYVLDFLGLQDRYLEKDLEDAILRELESFLLELGAGFSFIARQKRIQVDNDDYYLDLLFFHRRLKRLVAIELKLGQFKPADKGQMELYLRWLDKYERQTGEEPPIGLILCAGKKHETVELLELERSGMVCFMRFVAVGLAGHSGCRKGVSEMASELGQQGLFEEEV